MKHSQNGKLKITDWIGLDWIGLDWIGAGSGNRTRIISLEG
ncbi:hypothetical protein THOG05_50204 [Vibrio rotiferianus]|nr:hypothetical protein THOG05_50204 [Vibrio rotiferianus]